MDAKHIAMAHGEKAVVALVALFSGWLVYSAFTDPGIRPDGQGVTQQSIQTEIDAINSRMGSKDYPNLTPPKAYVQAMENRFAVDLPRPQRLSWLFAHPDIDGSVSQGPYFYVYEIYQPAVAASDDIGKVILRIVPPDGNLRAPDPAPDAAPGDRPTISDRHSAALDWVKSRPTERGEIVNQAHMLGIMVDMAIGQDGWHPLDVPGQISNGFVPMSALSRGSAVFKFKSTATWQEVRFRVRAVIKATGFTGTDAHADETILVHQGPWTEPKDWKDLDAQNKADPQSLLRQFVQFDDSAPPLGVTLAKGEHLYYTDWNDPPEARAIVTAEVRFAFSKFEGDPQNPAAGTAQFLVSRQFPGGRWLDKPHVFSLKLNEDLGAEVDDHKPGDAYRSQIDLTTPFRLVEIKPAQPRTLFWIIRPITVQPGPNAPPGTRSHKELELHPEVRNVTVAVLQNKNTGDKTEFACLETIVRPDPKRDPFFYPIVPKRRVNEVDEFQANPAGYVQLPMEAKKPVELDPKDPNGPLAQLHNNPNVPRSGQATSEVPYYQLADGRLVWYNEENRLVFEYPELPIPDDAPATASKPAAKPAPVRTAPRPESSSNQPGNSNYHGPPPPTGQSNFQGPPPGVGPPGQSGGNSGAGFGGPGGGAPGQPPVGGGSGVAPVPQNNSFGQ